MGQRITPVHWRKLMRVFELDGFTFVKRTDGSHWVGEKPGVSRPLVIPRYPEIDVDIIAGLMRTAGMSRVRYLELLAQA